MKTLKQDLSILERFTLVDGVYQTVERVYSFVSKQFLSINAICMLQHIFEAIIKPKAAIMYVQTNKTTKRIVLASMTANEAKEFARSQEITNNELGKMLFNVLHFIIFCLQSGISYNELQLLGVRVFRKQFEVIKIFSR